MSTQDVGGKPFNAEQEARKAAHEELNKREEQGVKRGGALEQAAETKAEKVAREAWAEGKNKGGAGITQPSATQGPI
ncbi:hypothetical protein BS17DRAFT_787718 [Gyrodon lividus]|nr:hypothetical protein BS17DRAFT_787718 [Gyrodon lividus]